MPDRERQLSEEELKATAGGGTNLGKGSRKGAGSAGESETMDPRRRSGAPIDGPETVDPRPHPKPPATLGGDAEVDGPATLGTG